MIGETCDVCHTKPVKYIVVTPWDPDAPMLCICDTLGKDRVNHKCLQDYSIDHPMPSATLEYDIDTWESASIIRWDE